MKALGLFLILSGALVAQNALAPNPCIWDGPNLVVTHPERGIAAQCESPTGKIVWKVPHPKPLQGGSLLCYDYCNGRLYAREHRRAQDAEGLFFFTAIFVFEEGKWRVLAQGKWRPTAREQDQHPVPFELYELGNGKYLSVGSMLKGKGQRPFYIWRVSSSGDFEVTDSFDAGLGKPFFKPDGKHQYPGLFDLGLYPITRCGGYLVAASQASGYFWVVDSGKGNLKRVVRLFNGLSEDVVEKKAGLPVLLGVQPTRDGDLLIASRTETAGLFGDDTRFQHPDSAGTSSESWWSEFLRFHNRHADESSKAFPVVQWWHFYLGDGRLHEVATPQNVKSRIECADDLRNFNWRFKPDGNLLFLDQMTFVEAGKP